MLTNDPLATESFPQIFDCAKCLVSLEDYLVKLLGREGVSALARDASVVSYMEGPASGDARSIEPDEFLLIQHQGARRSDTKLHLVGVAEPAKDLQGNQLGKVVFQEEAGELVEELAPGSGCSGCSGVDFSLLELVGGERSVALEAEDVPADRLVDDIFYGDGLGPASGWVLRQLGFDAQENLASGYRVVVVEQVDAEDVLDAVADEQLAQGLERGVGDLQLFFREEKVVVSIAARVSLLAVWDSGWESLHIPREFEVLCSERALEPGDGRDISHGYGERARIRGC